MAFDKDFLEFVLEQLDDFDISHKKMFGGIGLYCQDVFFALIENDRLRFKVDDSNRNEFEKFGMKAFKPFDDKAMLMNYYEVPGEILESRYELGAWVEKALFVAINAKKK